MLSTVSTRLKSRSSKVILPASILEKSRISLMIVRSASPLPRMVSVNSRCRGLSSPSSSSPVMPITPFIGVRISWLMLARNSLLARSVAFRMISCPRIKYPI